MSKIIIGRCPVVMRGLNYYRLDRQPLGRHDDWNGRDCHTHVTESSNRQPECMKVNPR